MNTNNKPILVLDMDGTFLKNDFFSEALFLNILNKPFFILRLLLKCKNWTRFKASLLEKYNIDNTTLEFLINKHLVEWVLLNKHHFSSIHIVSASPDNFVETIFNHLKSQCKIDYINSWHGSTDKNLSGLNKLDYIHRNLNSRYWYIGDSDSDFKIFQEAEGAIQIKNNNLIILHGTLY